MVNPNKALWEKGDFTRIADSMRHSGEQLVEGLGVAAGMAVLDLGCGDGTTAIPQARLGADVLGIDIARNLVEAGQRRARELGLRNCRFAEGCATDLANLQDGCMDLVTSFFGVMFAPRPQQVAREMVRVTRKGGRIVMGNWIPNDPTLVAEILRITSSYLPPPSPGLVSPMEWGIEERVLERFGEVGISCDQITFGRASWGFDYPGPPAAFLGEFRDYYGPTMNAFEAARKAGTEDQLARELLALFTTQNVSQDSERTVIFATYLQVTVSC